MRRNMRRNVSRNPTRNARMSMSRTVDEKTGKSISIRVNVSRILSRV